MKIRSKTELLEAIQQDKVWRFKELINLRGAIQCSRKSNKNILLRSGVLLLYAHWEGFVKNSCQYYFRYLNHKSIKYSELTLNYRALGIPYQFESNNFPSNNFSAFYKAADFIKNPQNHGIFRVDVDKISTQSNLNTEVMIGLLNMIGLDSQFITNHHHHIDERLLKYRNAIAHGENTSFSTDYDITEVSFSDLYERIKALIDEFESRLTNHFECENFMVSA
ncbi:MAE_28990/MAE_18760 family HEPN-like nuclease [Enterovibrio sp. Hal110]